MEKMRPKIGFKLIQQEEEKWDGDSWGKNKVKIGHDFVKMSPWKLIILFFLLLTFLYYKVKREKKPSVKELGPLTPTTHNSKCE